MFISAWSARICLRWTGRSYLQSCVCTQIALSGCKFDSLDCGRCFMRSSERLAFSTQSRWKFLLFSLFSTSYLSLKWCIAIHQRFPNISYLDWITESSYFGSDSPSCVTKSCEKSPLQKASKQVSPAKLTFVIMYESIVKQELFTWAWF